MSPHYMAAVKLPAHDLALCTRVRLKSFACAIGAHGPSYVYGYRGVAFETTKAGYLASATLFIA